MRHLCQGLKVAYPLDLVLLDILVLAFEGMRLLEQSVAILLPPLEDGELCLNLDTCEVPDLT